ncbi:hypothetical protein IFR05_011244 [Cadophora sp. M221]|nr:hypothetical protein IFR05_011244 [Cadophora sp. M221]
MSDEPPVNEIEAPKTRLGKRGNLRAIEPKIYLDGPDDWRHPKRWKQNPEVESASSNSTDDSDDPQDGDVSNKLAPLSSHSHSLAIVCFGMIHDANAKVLDLDEFSRVKLDGVSSISNLSQLQLSFKSDAVLVGPSEAEPMAVLNEETAKVLRNLSIMKSCQFKGYLSTSTGSKISPEQHGKGSSKVYILVDIVIYGSDSIRNSVGTLLSCAKTYLQHPCFQDPNTEYDNPHVLDLSRLFRSSSLSTPNSTETKPALVISSDVGVPSVLLTDSDHANDQLKSNLSRVFNSLTRFKSLKRLEADIKVTTPLLGHQKEALDFMAQRELGPIPQEYSLWSKFKREGETFYENSITGTRTESIPNETLGGILADDMGLGKTLTVISTIIRTATFASQFAERGNRTEKILIEDQSAAKRVVSRGTLVIVPSPLLIDGWKKEIELHCDGSLNVNVYHGRGREVSSKALADWDIVLSTYHTIAAEAADEDSPLHHITWFRIVLDEAHIIRRMSTKLFQSVAKLSGEFRWCLTGTPIQNSLEDLAALVAFIKCSPLDTLPEFRKHIVSPLLKGSDEGVHNLRVLLDSICLRRTKKLLDLPDVIDQDRMVDFSSAEKSYYDETEAEMVATIKRQDSHARNSKDYFGIFQLQLQLRRLCNHGTFQKSFAKPTMQDAQIDPEQAFDFLRCKRKARCTYCQTKVQRLNGYDDGDRDSGEFTACGHLICIRCVPRFEETLQQESDSSLRCPLCSRSIPKKALPSNGTTRVDVPAQKINFTTVPQYAKGGNASKIAYLLEDIKGHDSEGKSIVFSSWTRSLDLVGHRLKQKKIDFLRVDGTYTLSQRQTILDDYEKNPTVRILLMTTGTGAVGLNLTVANTVYIMEPQWNPMIESQAIARVLRIGQDRDVKVIRYIVKGSVEEMMRSQQLRKLGFARMGWKEAE